MADYWDECFTPASGLSPQDFTRICRICQNHECERSAASGLSWVRRMATQMDRLFVNPKFADPNDPRYDTVRHLEFAPVRGQPIEIGVRGRPGGGDWASTGPNPPTSAVPAPPRQAPVAANPPRVDAPTHPEPVKVILREVHVRGSGETYRVALEREGDQEPEWTCECRAFKFGSSRPCKHILYASSLAPEGEPEPAQQPPPARFVGSSAQAAPPLPRLANIPVPAGGVMVDGSAPPPPRGPAVQDAWEAPKPKVEVVPVHGKVVMGGNKGGKR